MTRPLEPFHLRGFRFGCAIVRLYMKLAKLPSLPIHLSRQLLKSGTSIGANLEEAKGAHSRGDNAAKFSIALRHPYGCPAQPKHQIEEWEASDPDSGIQGVTDTRPPEFEV
jgi:23S rRNA-intervening sequence protein